MKRCIQLTLALLALPVLAQGQGMGGYASMKLNYFGDMKVVNNAIQEISNGFDLELTSSDPSQPGLPIKADHAKFIYAEGGKSPVRIVMEGGVDIKHPSARVVAQKADWDFVTGDLTFTGSPVVNTADIQGLKCEKIIINTNDNTYEISRGSIDNFTFSTPDGPADPALLTEADVTDWGGLLTQLKAQAAADEPSPGRAIMGQLDAKLQGPLTSLANDQLIGMKADLLKAINGVLRAPGLYDESAWAGIALSDETKALAAKSGRSAGETTRLNRQLLAAAYPGAVKGL